MADEQLGAELDLDIAGALSSVDDLGSAIEQALSGSVESFADLMGAAVAAVPDVELEADTTAIEPAITTAVESADTEAEIEADTAAVTPDIDAAVQAADTGLVIDAETEGMTADIDSAVGSADTTVEVHADTSDAQSAIENIQGEDVEIAVDADTSDAQAAIDDLSSSATEAGSAMSAGGAGGRDFGAGADFAAAGAGLAAGSASELVDATSGVSDTFKVGAVAGGAFATTLGVLFTAGVDSTGAMQRFKQIVGETGPALETINVGSLNDDLDHLALKLGTDDEALRNTAASLFQFAKNSGAGDQAADGFAEKLIGLASRAVALNPSLGSVSDVADAMSVRLQRGGRFAASFGLDLNAADIANRAMADSGKTNTAQLSIYEKTQAAANLAVERYGDSIQHTVNEGAQNAIIVQHRLNEEIRNVIESAGRAVVVPMFDLIEAALPIIGDFAQLAGNLGSAVLPSVAAAFAIVEPPLQVVTALLEVLGPILPPLAAGFITFLAVTEGVPLVMGLVASGLITLTEVAPAAAAAIGLTATGIEAAEVGIATALPVIGLIVGALAIGATAFGLFGGGAEEGSQQLDDFTSSVEAANGKLDESAVKAAAALFKERNQSDDLAHSGVQLADVLAATSQAHGRERDLLDRVGSLTQALVIHQENLASASDQGKASTAGLNAERDRTIATLAKTNPALADIVSSLLAEDSTNSGVINTLSELSAQRDAATQSAHDNAQAGLDEASAAREAQSAAQLEAQAQGEAAAARKANADGVKALAAEQQQIASDYALAQEASAGYALGVRTAEQAEQALKTASDDLSGSLDLLLGRFVSADQQSNNFHLALQGLGDDLLANGFAFDANTKAGLENRNNLDEVASKASSTATAILNSTGNITAAVAPLEEFRGSLVSLRDAMRNAGQDTSFLDGLLTNVDNAIAGVQGKTPAMVEEARKLTAAGAAGGALTADDWTALGEYLGSQGVAGASFTQDDWDAIGRLLADSGKEGAQGTVSDWLGTGGTLGQTGAAGAQNTLGSWISAGGNIAGAAVSAAAGQAGAMRGAGTGVGQQGTAGLAGGMSGMPGVASGSVLDSTNAAALAGANAHNVGYGIGAALSSGIGDGIIANDNYVQSQARAVVNHAEEAARAAADAHSPSRLFAAIGHDLSSGLAVGISDSAHLVAAASSDLIDAAGGTIEAGHDLMEASTPWTPAVGGDGPYGGGDLHINFDVQVHGVADPAAARVAGEELIDGAMDALTRRGIVVTARLG